MRENTEGHVKDIVITGASRGIGEALALALAERPPFPLRLILTARDEGRLREVTRAVEATGVGALCIPGDLSTLAAARALGERIRAELTPPALLVHNAGLWPARRVLTSDGLERAFAVNFIGPLALQQTLLAQRSLDRILVISAGLLVKGRFSAERTPAGEDFSVWRTYCTTKLAFAVAEREEAVRHPEIDLLVLHPGVVRTELGARRGVLGGLLRLMKRSMESPAVCAARLRALFELDRWSPAGQARWRFEAEEQPWPAVTDDAQTRQAVLETAARLLA